MGRNKSKNKKDQKKQEPKSDDVEDEKIGDEDEEEEEEDEGETPEERAEREKLELEESLANLFKTDAKHEAWLSEENLDTTPLTEDKLFMPTAFPTELPEFPIPFWPNAFEGSNTILRFDVARADQTGNDVRGMLELDDEPEPLFATMEDGKLTFWAERFETRDRTKFSNEDKVHEIDLREVKFCHNFNRDADNYHGFLLGMDDFSTRKIVCDEGGVKKWRRGLCSCMSWAYEKKERSVNVHKFPKIKMNKLGDRYAKYTVF